MATWDVVDVMVELQPKTESNIALSMYVLVKDFLMITTGELGKHSLLLGQF